MTPNKIFHLFGICVFAALLTVAFAAKPAIAVDTGTPQAPTDDGKKKKGSAIDEQQQQLARQKFFEGYRLARERILAGDYQGGIVALRALNQDNHPDVANYIGYANRKLGNYEDSKYWYEKALAADAGHTRTWSYYGMWQMEQGNRLKALDYLAKVKSLCGNTTCREYTELKAVIDGTGTY